MDFIDATNIEFEWHEALAGKSLIAEVEADVQTALEAMALLGERMRTAPTSKDRNHILQAKTATVAIGLTTIGSTKYESGTLWPHVGEVFGYELEQTDIKALSAIFHGALYRYGLSRFDPPLKNVGEILLHGGVPIRSLGKLLLLLQQRVARRPEMQASEFCAWLESQTRQEAVSKGIDTPTWRFIAETGDVAVDFIDRLLTLLDALAGDGVDSGAAFEAVPESVAAEIQRLLEAGELKKPGRARAKSRRSNEPSINYLNGEVQLHLPHLEVTHNRDIHWQIVGGGESRDRTVAKPWTGDVLQPVIEGVNAPVSSLTVRARGIDDEWTVKVVDPQQPILAFDEQNHTLLATTAQLPKGRVWLAFPGIGSSDPVSALEIEGTMHVVSDEAPPLGWNKWHFVHVDLSEVTRLRSIAESAKEFRWRYVSSVKRPQLAEAPTLSFVRTDAGAEIFIERPKVIIPGVEADAEGKIPDVRWQIGVFADDGSELHTIVVRSTAQQMQVDPWPSETGDLRGQFEVRVQGPLGRGARLSVALAEGVRVETSSEFRWFQREGGLEPAQVTIANDGAESVLNFAPTQSQLATEITQTNSAKPLPVIVALPHQWLSVGLDGHMHAERSIGPVSLDVEMLSASTFRLQLEPGKRADFTLRRSDDIHQSWFSFSSHAGVLNENLAQISDTAHRLGVCDLWLSVADRELLLLRLRPKQLVKHVSVEGDMLALEKEVDESDLEVGVYLELAPWKEPEVVHFPAGEVVSDVPESLVGSGPARLCVRVRDPWASPRWPVELPSFDDPNVRYLERPVNHNAGIEGRFISWAHDPHQMLPETSDALAYAVRIFPHIEKVVSSRSTEDLYADIAQLSVALGRESLSVFTSGPWNAKHHLRLVAEGWAATAPAGDDEADRHTWEVSPFFGLLQSGQRLLYGDERVRELVKQYLGMSALDIFDDGRDEFAKIGRVDENAIKLSHMPKQAVEEIWQAAAPIPGPLLDRDQRFIQARELFDARNAIDVTKSDNETFALLKGTHTLIEQATGREVLENTVFERSSEHKYWPSLPCVTLSLALVARLAARGDETALKVVERQKRVMIQLAQHAPAMLTQDLILAELWMLHIEGRTRHE